MVSPDSQATACLPSGRNSTYRLVQNSGTGSLRYSNMVAGLLDALLRRSHFPPFVSSLYWGKSFGGWDARINQNYSRKCPITLRGGLAPVRWKASSSSQRFG